MMAELRLSDGWIVVGVVDDDQHLNVYIEHEDGSDILDIESEQGNGRSGEQLALRFSTEKIESTYLGKPMEKAEYLPLIDQTYKQTLQLIKDQQEFITTWKPYAGRDALDEMNMLEKRVEELMHERCDEG